MIRIRSFGSGELIQKTFRAARYWCNTKVAQKKGLQFYQTRSNAVVLYNTLHAMCIEKVVYMKSGEELYNKVC